VNGHKLPDALLCFLLHMVKNLYVEAKFIAHEYRCCSACYSELMDFLQYCLAGCKYIIWPTIRTKLNMNGIFGTALVSAVITVLY